MVREAAIVLDSGMIFRVTLLIAALGMLYPSGSCGESEEETPPAPYGHAGSIPDFKSWSIAAETLPLPQPPPPFMMPPHV